MEKNYPPEYEIGYSKGLGGVTDTSTNNAMEAKIVIPPSRMLDVFGERDAVLRKVEDLVECEIIVRGNEIRFKALNQRWSVPSRSSTTSSAWSRTEINPPQRPPNVSLR